MIDKIDIMSVYNNKRLAKHFRNVNLIDLRSYFTVS